MPGNLQIISLINRVLLNYTKNEHGWKDFSLCCHGIARNPIAAIGLFGNKATARATRTFCSILFHLCGKINQFFIRSMQL